MRILLGGASGLIGSALKDRLAGDGHTINTLVRRETDGPDEIAWDPATGTLDASAVDGFDAAVLLSGYNIAKKRWSADVKQLIRDSRVQSASLLAETLAHAEQKPQVFACASAIGFYGDRGDEVCTEDSAIGPDEEFLPGVCAAWEAATAPAAAAGIRTVNLRIGPVLSPNGGALKEMLRPFRLGLGGPVGNGKQWFSWITLADVAGAIRHVLTGADLQGPVNLTAPNPVRNAELAKALGAAVHRPAVVPTPAFIVKLLFGQMGEELLLASTRVSCQTLQDSGYKFQHPELRAALQDLLK